MRYSRRRLGPPPSGDIDFEAIAAWSNVLWVDSPSWTGRPDDGNTAETWDNAGTTATDPTQGTAGRRPTMRDSVAAFDGHAGLEFDGTDDGLLSPTFATISDFSVAALVAPSTVAAGVGTILGYNNAGNFRRIARDGSSWVLYDGTNTVTSGQTAVVNEAALIVVENTATTQSISVNGETAVTGTNTQRDHDVLAVAFNKNGASAWYGGWIHSLATIGGSFTAGQLDQLYTFASRRGVTIV